MRFAFMIGCAATLIACGPAPDTEPSHPVADLVLTNGNVITVDDQNPSAQAVAAIGDRIFAVGSSVGIAAYIGDATEVIDLGGRTAIPGFIEGHGHYTSFGGSLVILDFRYSKSFSEIVSQVAAAAKETPKGEWIIGRGWHQDKWQTKEDVLIEGLPVHESLSAATPDHPAMLIHTSGHAVFVNQKAMTLVELNDDSVAPEGGEIVRDENGRATGMMRESAQDVFRQAFSGNQGRRPAGVAEDEMRRMVLLAGDAS